MCELMNHQQTTTINTPGLVQYIFNQCYIIFTVYSNGRASVLLGHLDPCVMTTSPSPTSHSRFVTSSCQRDPISPCSSQSRPHHLPSVTVCPPVDITNLGIHSSRAPPARLAVVTSSPRLTSRSHVMLVSPVSLTETLISTI